MTKQDLVYVITGASRGLGLEYVKQVSVQRLSKPPHNRLLLLTGWDPPGMLNTVRLVSKPAHLEHLPVKCLSIDKHEMLNYRLQFAYLIYAVRMTESV